MTQSSTNVNWHPDKGVIYVGDGTGVLSELSVGTNDQVMTADSTQSSGVKYAEAASGGAWTFISSATASSSATLDFASGIDSTYGQYIFIFTDLVSQTDNVDFYWRSSTDGGVSYDEAADDYKYAGIGASRTEGLLTDTNLGNDTGESLSGNMTLFSPSKTASVKYTVNSTFNITISGGANDTTYYFYRDSTADIDAMRFFMSSGNITSGVIRMYGIATS